MNADITRQVRLAWELYAVKELGMSAGVALAKFERWLDDSAAANMTSERMIS